MRDLTISEMEMVFGGANRNGSSDNGSVYGPPNDQDDPYGRRSDYPSGRDVLDRSPSYPQGSAGSNPSLNTGPSVPLGGGVTAQPGYYGTPSNPSGGGIRVNIPIGH